MHPVKKNILCQFNEEFVVWAIDLSLKNNINSGKTKREHD
jgi:hypothetical protein